MKPLVNERHVGRILKKPREAWEIVEGDLDGRPVIEIRLVHESGGRWLPSSMHPFRCRADAASEIGAALCSVNSGGGAA